MILDDVIVCMGMRLCYCKEEMIWKCLLMICVYELLIRWMDEENGYVLIWNFNNECKWDS